MSGGGFSYCRLWWVGTFSSFSVAGCDNDSDRNSFDFYISAPLQAEVVGYSFPLSCIFESFYQS